MNSDFKKGDEVIVLGKVLHVRQDGGVDVEIPFERILFNVDPEFVGLVVEGGEIE